MNWFVGLVVAGAFWASGARAADPVNNAFVGAQLYLWNRLADFTEILQGGVAVGPCIGAELGVTKYATIGGYTSWEQGAAFPHFIPPLWIINYLDDQTIFLKHKGEYKTRVFLNDQRWESTGLDDVRFPRGPWDVRAQLAAGLVHLSLSVQVMQVYDFLVGFICMDPLADDQVRDPTARRQPARQLGRGACNIVTGLIEIPRNMHEINQERGGFAAISYGLARGVWRTAARIGVGVMEVVTFPMGWDAIIEPEFPFEPTKTTVWRVNQPAFRRQY
jgi:putative exosortase-associated protein (TIGR04073 family)